MSAWFRKSSRWSVPDSRERRPFPMLPSWRYLALRQAVPDRPRVTASEAWSESKPPGTRFYPSRTSRPVIVVRSADGASRARSKRLPRPPQILWFRPRQHSAACYTRPIRWPGIDGIVIAGATRAELYGQAPTHFLGDSSSSAEHPIPKCASPYRDRSESNPCFTVTVNGAEVRLRWGAPCSKPSQAAEAPPRVQDASAQLALFKPYAGRPVRVEFDRNGAEILDLVLLGRGVPFVEMRLPVGTSGR